MIALAKLKEWLGVTESTYDTALTELEVRAVAFVERITGRYFGAVAATTVYLDGSGTRYLYLPETVASGLTVQVESSAGIWEDVSEDDYATRDSLLVHGSSWTAGTGNYRATFSRGYASGAEPGEIRQLVLDLCALKWHARRAEHLEGEVIGGYSQTFRTGDISELDAWGVIEMWRRPVFA